MSLTIPLLRFASLGLLTFFAAALAAALASIDAARSVVATGPQLVCAQAQVGAADAGIRYCFDANAMQPSFPVPVATSVAPRDDAGN